MRPIRVTVSKKPGAVKRAQEEAWNQYMERLRALHGAGRVTPELVKLLPGFRVIYQKEGGRPARWGFMRLFFLWFDVRHVMEQEHCSERKACEVLFSRREYEDCERPTTLHRRLNEAKTSPIVQFAQDAIADIGWARWFETAKHFLNPKVREDILRHDIRP